MPCVLSTVFSVFWSVPLRDRLTYLEYARYERMSAIRGPVTNYVYSSYILGSSYEGDGRGMLHAWGRGEVHAGFDG